MLENIIIGLLGPKVSWFVLGIFFGMMIPYVIGDK